MVIIAEEGCESFSDYDSSDSGNYEGSLSIIIRNNSRFGRLHSYVNCLMNLAPLIQRRSDIMREMMKAELYRIENRFRLSEAANSHAMRIRDR
ncbi:uncharacterized protein N7483_007517 [Penicillium malachiteum]|uniref:uncharacterized protein n=1 Tax=Penicillium malachiteum TaxID=1324776 RepID=UPI002546F614|nr:uncharacterized protein N7483_007517 [Penicillium malachiteum]KAJ5726160.1 hypothetical protein N7483_007517 [Penicillium malachiteum]